MTALSLVPDEELEPEPVRFSRLKLMALSPAHYHAATQQPTGAKERGSALHSLVLGGKQVVAYPGKVRRGKEYDEFLAAHADAIILTKSDWSRATGMAEAVTNHRQAMEVLRGQHEVEVDWSYLGRACQSHVDVFTVDYVTELKSTASSNPDKFAWQSLRYLYDAQLAFYMEAILSSGLGVPREAFVVAVESCAPYVVSVMRATERALDHGRRSCRLWMERLLGCEAANEWPGYVGSIVPLDVPEDEPELTFGTAELADEEATAGEELA